MTDISIVIPIKNDVRYIDSTVNSILAQDTTLSFEVLLVDYGSTDGTAALAALMLDKNVKDIQYSVLDLKKRSKEDKDVSYLLGLYDSGEGPAAACNLGIIAANAGYVLFLEPGDLLAKGALDNLWNKANSGVYDIVMGKTKVMKAAGNRTDESAVAVEYTGQSYRAGYFAGKFESGCWNKLVRKSFLCINDLFFDQRETSCKDILWNFSVAVAKPSVAVIPTVTCLHWPTAEEQAEKNGLIGQSLALLSATDKALDKVSSLEEWNVYSQKDSAKDIALYLIRSLKHAVDCIVRTKFDAAVLNEVVSILSKKSVRHLFDFYADSNDTFAYSMKIATAPYLCYFRKRKLSKLLKFQNNLAMDKAFQRVTL